MARPAQGGKSGEAHHPTGGAMGKSRPAMDLRATIAFTCGLSRGRRAKTRPTRPALTRTSRGTYTLPLRDGLGDLFETYFGTFNLILISPHGDRLGGVFISCLLHLRANLGLCPAPNSLKTDTCLSYFNMFACIIDFLPHRRQTYCKQLGPNP